MWMGSIRSSSRTFRESCCCDPRTALCSLRLEYDFGKRGESLSAVPVIQVTGVPESPTQFAPADEAAFNDLFVGKRAATDFPTVYADFVSPGRFRETRFLDIWAGSYAYRNTGSDTGTVTFNYDDGDRCTTSLTFDSTTTGTAAFTCDDGSSGEYNWRLVEIPSG